MPEYKLTEDGKAIAMQDGRPVVIDGDKEYTVDAIKANQKVREAMAEAKKHRKAAADAKARAEKFAGIEDPEEAIKALETVAGLDDKLNADLDKLKDALNKSWGDKLAEAEQKVADLNTDLYRANVTSKFAVSPVAKELVLPVDIAVKTFGDRFKPDGTAVNQDGDVILSKDNPGEPAKFDEALTALIDERSDKDSLLKSTVQSGSGGYDQGSGRGGGDAAPVDNIADGLRNLS